MTGTHIPTGSGAARHARPNAAPQPVPAAAGQGPLTGLRVVELAAIGPVPHAAMILADLGADVVRVERPSGGLDLAAGRPDHLLRGRRSVHADLKTPAGRDIVRRLAARADVLLEGFRPGVAERLGVGPDECRRANHRLVYARMTGWGQTGPLARRAGHDINYLSLTGVLHAIGPPDGRPVPPLNLVGDYGGGSMMLLTGVLAALWERGRSGEGQVIDCAMVDGVSVLGQVLWALTGVGQWQTRRGANLLDGGAPFYDTYRCRDGRYVAVGALEPRFYSALLAGLGLDPADLPGQMDREGWPTLRARFAATFRTQPRDHWARVFAGTDACVTPVLTLEEVAAHPHIAARRTIIEVDGVPQPAPAPRFSRTPPAPPRSLPDGAGTESVLTDWEA
ncbi:alpha-methylacyl-CoA racemase [Thermocatellispora tengchongensis]|uniref:Alpha-methylacyl-CoA racemase n=1 Tax=Thermocatellispora tengchongensis TaxID=1073253 RepID=A0A840PJ16_9ACTN|nr:CaiB/BaiF CoA-transferase family protein [Thermocatellispora tengchongensis]MBB5136065.1 alpha-methylacyl-CoA racemase [Thermocatellispora tengchongensis]